MFFERTETVAPEFVDFVAVLDTAPGPIVASALYTFVAELAVVHEREVAQVAFFGRAARRRSVARTLRARPRRRRHRCRHRRRYRR